MAKPTLVIMAAGMGSRYGGLKQIDPVGPSGEIIMDYSIYDAIRAGFGKIIFIISKEIEDPFKEMIGHVSGIIPVEYVIQGLDDLPAGFSAPAGRKKPWGTGHAVYCCRHVIDGPFAVINADDFYGADAFMKVSEFLGQTGNGTKYHCCMAGYLIENTITENGYVSRGVCDITPDGYLSAIVERTRIEPKGGAIVYAGESGEWEPIEPGSVVSMNMWGFPPSILADFENYLIKFMEQDPAILEKGEFFLPFVVNGLAHEGKADIKVLKTDSQWYGVTYREDKETVVCALNKMVRDGVYPERLWHNEK